MVFPWPFCRQFGGQIELEMEQAKSPREIALGVIPQGGNFWLLTEGPNCGEPHGKNLLYPRKCSLSFEKSLRDRYPIGGKMDTQNLINVPLYFALCERLRHVLRDGVQIFG